MSPMPCTHAPCYSQSTYCACSLLLAGSWLLAPFSMLHAPCSVLHALSQIHRDTSLSISLARLCRRLVLSSLFGRLGASTSFRPFEPFRPVSSSLPPSFLTLPSSRLCAPLVTRLGRISCCQRDETKRDPFLVATIQDCAARTSSFEGLWTAYLCPGLARLGLSIVVVAVEDDADILARRLDGVWSD